MKVGVLDHSMGNLRSVGKALEAAGADVVISDDPVVLGRSDALCVPGQGIFGRCMTALDRCGLTDLVKEWIGADRPYLGICLGMQVLFSYGRESSVPGLGIVAGEVVKMEGGVPVPHIGWNEVETTAGNTYFYFDHSYVVTPEDLSIVTGWSEHGGRFVASLGWNSITATQFHPEKSGADGIRFLKGWVTS